MIDVVSTAWDRAVEYKAKQETKTFDNWLLKLDWENSYVLEQSDGKDEVEGFTKDRLMELFRFLITENYIWNGKELRKQDVGIPMGSPVSPHLANLFRYVVEAKFIEEMLAAGQKELALACEHTFGYIDD